MAAAGKLSEPHRSTPKRSAPPSPSRRRAALAPAPSYSPSPRDFSQTLTPPRRPPSSPPTLHRPPATTPTATSIPKFLWNSIVGGYSEEFERSFMDHIRRAHRFSRVAATVVYNEYIADRRHVHMNSTQWATLTDFVKYLGRTGQCEVDETPKGWFICYIDRDSESLFKDRLKQKRIKSDFVEEERQERAIAAQIEHATSHLPPPTDTKPLEPVEKAQPDGGKVAFALPAIPVLETVPIMSVALYP